MKTAIVPIIKNKSGNSIDKANYRPLALVTACSKIFELCLLIMLEKYLHTHDQQFGFKSQHATDMQGMLFSASQSHGSRRLKLREPFVARADFYLCYGNYFS